MLGVRLSRIVRLVGFILAVWVSFGLLMVVKQLYVQPEAEDVADAIAATAIDVAAWATVTPIALFAAIGLLAVRTRTARAALLLALVAFGPLVLAVRAHLAAGARSGLSAMTEDRREDMAASVYMSVFPLLGIGAAALVVRARRKSEEQRRREAELRRELAAAELQQLRADLEPHFLFNSLNSVAGLVPADPIAAEKMLGDLADLLERSLRWETAAEIPLEEEVGFIGRYLDIQRIRLGDRLTARIDVHPVLGRLLVPPLILQPLVENAIRHGVAAVEGNGVVEVRASTREGQLFLEVRDSGPGFMPGNVSSGLGIENVRARLRLLFGPRQSLTFASAGGRFVARIVLPAKWQLA